MSRHINLLLVSAVGSCTLMAVGQSSTFKRTLGSSDHPDVYVSTGSGSVRVTPSDGSHVVVVGHVHSGWQQGGDVEERVRRIAADPPIVQTGDSVHIGEASDRSLFNNISIDYEIHAPRNAALSLRTGSGDLRTEGVGRFIAANSGSGTIQARGVHGPADLYTGSGDVELGGSGPGEVRVRTGSGSLRLHGLDGPLKAHSGSGDIEADGHLQGPGEISSGSGSIRLRIDPQTRLDLSATTGSGSIHAEVAGLTSSSEDRHDVHGTLNGGGPPLDVHTGSGDIDIAADH